MLVEKREAFNDLTVIYQGVRKTDYKATLHFETTSGALTRRFGEQCA